MTESITTTTITSRAGHFTSSKIWKLMTNDRKGTGIGAPGLTYIAEKKLEIKLGRQLEKEIATRASSWGTFVQHRVTNTLLDSGCKPTKDIRRVHPIISNWSGAEDYLREDCIGEIKCFELKNFGNTYDSAEKGYDILKEECEDVFWQLVSNSILLGTKYAELTLYVPYKRELEAIREEASLSDDENIKWLSFNTNDDQLPYLIEGKHYKNLSSWKFEVNEEDKLALTNRVIMANQLLLK